MERQVKAALVEDLKTSVGASASLVLVDFNGLTVEKSVELRNKCRESQVRFKVVKNTLVKKVVEGTDQTIFKDFLVLIESKLRCVLKTLQPEPQLSDVAQLIELSR